MNRPTNRRQFLATSAAATASLAALGAHGDPPKTFRLWAMGCASDGGPPTCLGGTHKLCLWVA